VVLINLKLQQNTRSLKPEVIKITTSEISGNKNPFPN
jgi:hypothetical protein